MHRATLLIDNESRDAAQHRTFVRRDPLNGNAVTEGAAASIDDAKSAVEAAARAFPAWSQTNAIARRALLNRAADIMDSKSAEFAAVCTEETGATGGWGGFNVHLAANMLREAAAMTTQILGQTIPTAVPDNLAMSVRVPLGVCLGVAPWNAPIILGVRALAMPLACGNTVVLKGAEASPYTHRLIGECFVEAGFPPGVVNVVSNHPAEAAVVMNTLIAHPAVRHVNFTGSTAVGRIIAQRAAEHLKPALLELGGKAPLVVLAGADVDAAVNAAVFGGYMNQGQICMSTDRVIVDASIADEFVSKLTARLSDLAVGDGREHVHLGTLIDAGAGERIQALLDDARERGATVFGGEMDGALMRPAVVDRVGPQMRIKQEEIFGPAVSIIRVEGDDEAIEAANDTEYGLSAAVFCRDIGRALSAAQRIQSGICHVNGPTVHDEAQMPFGGVKNSGYGRFGGTAAVEAFTAIRWITIQTGTRHYPF